MKLIIQILGQRSIMSGLLIVNIIGTIYGYIWYGWQLKDTPAHFLIFVPDSPTASLFFVFVLIAFLLKKNWPLLESLAIITLFKYGIWAVVMNLLVLIVTGELGWQGYMLIASHFAMAVQGLLYSPYYRMKISHLVIGAIWTLHNDVIDYVFGQMPRYHVLADYSNQIGYFTFWLSLLSIYLAYRFGVKNQSFQLEAPSKVY
ncbi:DUF1405 domain-containing protein [Bacillus solimangrovi]|uniref:DUF1405 domain-containing protein n=1 Tax=Bacillus solimangrovi TaxID=1305675 RepID=A0A1E5LH79_9BACI|nr:DUF1405 domain-containing protein [Bacillus solimangrovi]OEH93433.1 hypothetical protein BFG57_00110 [Bacillus solimangrovi]